MSKVIFVICPSCQKEFYVETSDYINKPDAPCHCPFCAQEFAVREGKPRPPLSGGASRQPGSH
jgi:hypothetical protein